MRGRQQPAWVRALMVGAGRLALRLVLLALFLFVVLPLGIAALQHAATNAIPKVTPTAPTHPVFPKPAAPKVVRSPGG
jgi:predicted secreted protein